MSNQTDHFFIIKEWFADHIKMATSRHNVSYVQDLHEFQHVDPKTTEYLLGEQIRTLSYSI